MSRRFRYKLDEATGKVVETEVVTEMPGEGQPDVHILNRPEVSIVSSVLPRWEKDHAANGGKFTAEGKPIIASRHQAEELCKRSQGERDVYYEYGDIDRLGT